MGVAAGPCHARVRVKTGVPSAKQSFFVNRLQRRGGEEGAGARAECSCLGRRLLSSLCGGLPQSTLRGGRRGEPSDARSLPGAELPVTFARRPPAPAPAPAALPPAPGAPAPRYRRRLRPAEAVGAAGVAPGLGAGSDDRRLRSCAPPRRRPAEDARRPGARRLDPGLAPVRLWDSGGVSPAPASPRPTPPPPPPPGSPGRARRAAPPQPWGAGVGNGAGCSACSC